MTARDRTAAVAGLLAQAVQFGLAASCARPPWAAAPRGPSQRCFDT